MWHTSYPCPLKRCGRVPSQVEGRRPSRDAMLTYVCPTTHRATGFRFSGLKWRELATCPAGSIVARDKPGLLLHAFAVVVIGPTGCLGGFSRRP